MQTLLIVSINLNYNLTILIIAFYEKINLLYSDTVCPICYNTINKSCRPNNCKHYFCLFCITKWSKISHKCPLCRRKFTYFKYI